MVLLCLLGNRMFSFHFVDVDAYLPQLLNMYIYVHDIAEALHPYLIYRYVFLVLSTDDHHLRKLGDVYVICACNF